MKPESRKIKKIFLPILLALSFLFRGSTVALIPLGVASEEAASEQAAEVNNQGVALYKKGELFDALIHFITASQMDQRLWKYHYNCAVVLLAAGNVEEARSHLDQSKKVDPDNPEMRRYHAALLRNSTEKGERGALSGDLFVKNKRRTDQ